MGKVVGKVVFLNDLLSVSEDNIRNDFGLKTAGIVKLKNIISNPNANIPRYVKVPDLFATSDLSFNSTDLKQAYIELTKDFREPKIILARSSDRDEKPGVFQTHTSLYRPEDIEGSFNNWIAAAQKVRDSGARAVIGQTLIGDLEDFEYDETWEEDDDHEYRRKRLTQKSFGGSTTSFFGNSVDFIKGKSPVIVGCYGLASKIARGDNDVSIIEYSSGYGFKAVNLNQNYKSQSFDAYEQRTVDIVLFDKPDVITTLRYECSQGRGAIYTFIPASVPFQDEPFDWNGDFADEKVYPRDLIELVDNLNYLVGRDIEIEGSISEEGLFLFQLREYDLPLKKLEKLTQVEDSKIILKPDGTTNKLQSLGFNQLSGDMYVSNKFIDIPQDAIFLYSGRDIHDWQFDFNQFHKYKKVLFQSYISSGLYAATHSYGQTVQTLFEFQKRGIEAIALGEDHISNLYLPRKISKDRVVKTEDYTMYKDVVAECVGLDAQIYFR